MIKSFAEAYKVKRAQLVQQREDVPNMEAQLGALREGTAEYEALKNQIQDIKQHKPVVEYIFSILPFVTKETECSRDEERTIVPQELTQVVDVEGTTNKGTVFAEYLRTVENVDTLQGPSVSRHADLMAACEYCGCTSLVIIDRDASRICSECGNVEVYQREDAPQFTFKEESENMTVSVQFAYKRPNHFCDWLNAFETGMSASNVPVGVLDTLRYELRKLRITDVSTITPTLIRQLLKKTDLTKYYEYTNAISAEISGNTPLCFPQELKCKLRVMFSQLQSPFQQFKPDNRKNFLSYSYVIYKCLQLLGQDSYLQYFTLLKSRDKLKLQDQIWRKICEHLKWEYISSV